MKGEVKKGGGGTEKGEIPGPVEWGLEDGRVWLDGWLASVGKLLSKYILKYCSNAVCIWEKMKKSKFFKNLLNEQVQRAFFPPHILNQNFIRSS